MLLVLHTMSAITHFRQPISLGTPKKCPQQPPTLFDTKEESNWELR